MRLNIYLIYDTIYRQIVKRIGSFYSRSNILRDNNGKKNEKGMGAHVSTQLYDLRISIDRGLKRMYSILMYQQRRVVRL